MQFQRKAFTLIELLVVIAIIAILAAILFPVFAQAKTAAKKTAHLSNEKQAGTSLLLYANDADDKLPTSPCFDNIPVPHGCDEPSRRSTWRLKVQPYMKQKDIFVPPGFDYPGSFNPGTVYWFGVNYAEEAKAGVKPGMAGTHTWTNPDFYGYQGLSTTEPSRPSSLIMLMPSRFEFADLGTWVLDYPYFIGGAYPGKGPMQAYNRMVNFTMMDTHAKSYNPCSTYGALKWADGTTPDDDFLWEWFSHNPNYGGPIQSSVLRGWQAHCRDNPEYK
ncbi:prepilin-type N-terminal cleavage/methylation domain-containing protein [bacterium]|nr:MAG: prepilin-type N-terminal cleavage/methylation domain-containing protein [bacterium]